MLKDRITLHNISRINPNTRDTCFHFVFRDYVCVAVSSSVCDGVLGMSLADFLASYSITFPDGANYIFIRTDLHEFKIREFGAIVNVYIKCFNHGKKN